MQATHGVSGLGNLGEAVGRVVLQRLFRDGQWRSANLLAELCRATDVSASFANSGAQWTTNVKLIGLGTSTRKQEDLYRMDLHVGACSARAIRVQISSPPPANAEIRLPLLLWAASARPA